MPLPPLVGETDPPAAEVVNPEGKTPLLLLCDHASNTIPACLDGLGLAAQALEEHIAVDIGAAEVCRQMAAMLDCPAVLCGYSRLVIDCNRQPGDPTAIPPMSDETVIPGNQALSEQAAQQRTDAIFWPYHRAINDVLAHLWRQNPQMPPMVIAMHSFTPCLSGGAPRPWHVGLLWNRDNRMMVPMMAALRLQGWCVGDNEPYSGREIAYTLDSHATAAGLPHVAVEIRQDLIADADGAAAWAGHMAQALRGLLGVAEMHRVEHL
jgi:predicted N-formylglutamate amidohydrolase